MGQVVLDSSNLDAIVKDATGEGLELPNLPMNSGVQTQIDAEAAKIIADVEAAKPIDPETDDVEGDDGLTPRQKRELTAKMQAAVGKKHRALKEAEEFATEQYNTRRAAEQRTAELQAQLDALKKPVEPVIEAKKPERKDFTDEDTYRDALVDWSVEQRLKLQAQKDAQAAADARQAQLLADASARIAKATELVPDFAEVTGAVDMEVPPAVAGYMQESEMFAELGYHFAKNPAELERLAKFTEGLRPNSQEYWSARSRQLVEIGKIESKLQPFTKSAKADSVKDDKPNGSSDPSTNGAKPSTETQQPASPRASAPVIRPLSSHGASQVDKPEAEMTAKEALNAWQKKKSVNLTRRSRH